MGNEFWQGVIAASAGWVGLSLVTCVAFAWIMHRTPLDEGQFDAEITDLPAPKPVPAKAPKSVTRTAA